MSHTILFDFDGTVALGDGPIRAFAEAVGEHLSGEQRDEFLSDVHQALDEALIHGFTPEQRDGYGLVNRIATGASLSDEQLNTSYHASRQLLANEGAPIHAPDGLDDFLRALPKHTQAVLVTNAPSTRIEEALTLLGLSGLFHDVICSAGKPAGMEEIAQPYADRGTLAGVGDIWVNDLEPLLKFDAFTALIGSPSPTITPDVSGPTLTELLPALTEWVQSRPDIVTTSSVTPAP